METQYEVIFCIVDAGYSELVMDAAKEVGARGGTVIHARGTANKEAEQFFQISIQPDKEIVMILVPTKIKDAVLHAVYQKAGLKTAGHGIAFAMEVENVVGLAPVAVKPEGKHETKPDGKNEVKAEIKGEVKPEAPAPAQPATAEQPPAPEKPEENK